MKKKFLLLIGLMMQINPCSQAEEKEIYGVRIILSVQIDDHELGNPVGKSPVQPPAVYLDGHSLYFGESYADAVPVELRDASGNVVYSDYLPAGVQTLSLPTTLSGTYTLLIYMGNYVFAGQINL